MDGGPNFESNDIHVFELFGVQVVRQYVEKSGKIRHGRDERHCLQILLKSLPVLVVLSAVFSISAMGGILYHPPPLVKDLTESLKELSESLLLSFGKRDNHYDALLHEQLKFANDRISFLKEGIEKLKEEGIANFTREERLRHNLSTLKKENTGLMQKLSEADKLIASLEIVIPEREERIEELEQNLNICINEKTGVQNSLSNALKQLDDTKRNVSMREDDIKLLNSNIKQHRKEISRLEKELEKADNISEELEQTLSESMKNLGEVNERKENLNKKLVIANSELSNCKITNEHYEKINTELAANLTSSKQDLAESIKNLDDSLFKLGKCRNKNMDHEARAAELITDLDSCQKELKKC